MANELKRAMLAFERAVEDLDDALEGRCSPVHAWDEGCGHHVTEVAPPLFSRVIQRALDDGLGRAEVARLAGVPLSTVDDWKAGHSQPSPRTQARVRRDIRDKLNGK